MGGGDWGSGFKVWGEGCRSSVLWHCSTFEINKRFISSSSTACWFVLGAQFVPSLLFPIVRRNWFVPSLLTARLYLIYYLPVGAVGKYHLVVHFFAQLNCDVAEEADGKL